MRHWEQSLACQGCWSSDAVLKLSRGKGHCRGVWRLNHSSQKSQSNLFGSLSSATFLGHCPPLWAWDPPGKKGRAVQVILITHAHTKASLEWHKQQLCCVLAHLSPRWDLPALPQVSPRVSRVLGEGKGGVTRGLSPAHRAGEHLSGIPEQLHPQPTLNPQSRDLP